jgi:predicted transcriptional regulator of viral defense system
MPGRNYNILHDQAVDQAGYVTTRDANALGVNPHRLQVMEQRGLIEQVSRGVYRFLDIPAGPHDAYVAATLWPLTVQGVLSHATAMDLHELCDINPARIDITVPRAFRTSREAPQVMRLHREDLRDAEITWYEGLPIVTVYRAIRGGIEQRVGWNLIQQALDTAQRTGRLTPAQTEELTALRPVGTR